MPKCNKCERYVRTAQGLKSHVTRLHGDFPSDGSQTQDNSQTYVKLLVTASSSKSRDDVGQAQDLPPSSKPVNGLGLAKQLAAFKSRLKILRRIPKGARTVAASALAETIDLCLRENSAKSWERLLLFAVSCFQVPPKQENKQVSLSTAVKRNIDIFLKGESSIQYSSDFSTKVQPGKKHTNTSNSSLAKQVETKLSEGDISGAVRILCSEDVFAPFNEETLDVLRNKHPEHGSQLNFPSDEEEASVSALKITEADVKAAVFSFPAGSAAGLDLLRPQHLKDLLGFSAGNFGLQLCSSLTRLCNLMLAGQVPEEICPVIYGASLCALKKKDGGTRPIAVGCTLRRLVAKMCCCHISTNIGQVLQPHQLGFGTKGGAEAAAHAARRYVDHQHAQPKVLLKIDFLNAFNMLHRDSILKTVLAQTPDLYLFIRQCYRYPSHLLFGESLITSLRGIQQGDPLGSALFSMTVLPVTTSMKSEFNVWFLDDATLGGTPEVVMEDFKSLKCLSADIGLEVNPSKCELFCLEESIDPSLTHVDFQTAIPGLRLPANEDCILLGAPLKDVAISGCLDSKIQALKLVSSRLAHISAHCAYFILKNSLAIPKLSYVLRCSPTWRNSEKLEGFDEILKASLESIINISLTNAAWEQSSLPISAGGLGIRHARGIAIPAFLASSSGVDYIVQSLLPLEVHQSSDVLVYEGLGLWQLQTRSEPPPVEKQHLQKAWDLQNIANSIERLHEQAITTKDKARLIGVSARESGAFLNAIPSVTLGTRLEDDAFRIAVALRLGANMCQAHVCVCGSEVDSLGTHGLCCKKSLGRFSRHAAVNDLIKRALASANIPSTLEPASLDRTNNRRPDGITLVPWSQGKSLTWDFTCTDSLAPSHLELSSVEALSAATKAERSKRAKYAHLSQTHIFTPVAVECLGGFGREALDFITKIGKKITSLTGEKRATEFFIQRVSVAIQRGNAAAIIGTIPKGASLDEYLGEL